MNMDASYIDILIQWLQEEGTSDLSSLRSPRLKPALQTLFPVFVALYAFVGVLGLLGNAALLVALWRRGLKEPSSVFLVNAGLLGIVLAGCVTPLTLAVMLLQNWVLGAMACWFYPMLQTLPLHATQLALLIALADRGLQARQPDQPRASTAFAVGSSAFIWGVGMVLALPFVFHVGYTDLGALGRDFEGMGICSVHSEREDIRKIHLVGLSLAYCFCPVISIIMAISTRLCLLQRKKVVESYEMKIRRGDGTYYYSSPSYAEGHHSASLASVDQLTFSLFHELKLLRYITAMVVAHALCWCPFMVLITAHQFDFRLEGRDTVKADLVHLALMLAAFMSSWVVPGLYALWRRSLHVELRPDSDDSDVS